MTIEERHPFYNLEHRSVARCMRPRSRVYVDSIRGGLPEGAAIPDVVHPMVKFVNGKRVMYFPDPHIKRIDMWSHEIIYILSANARARRREMYDLEKKIKERGLC